MAGFTKVTGLMIGGAEKAMRSTQMGTLTSETLPTEKLTAREFILGRTGRSTMASGTMV